MDRPTTKQLAEYLREHGLGPMDVPMTIGDLEMLCSHGNLCISPCCPTETKVAEMIGAAIGPEELLLTPAEISVLRAAVKVERDQFMEEHDDHRDALKTIMCEKYSAGAVHCSCVPTLKVEIARLTAELSTAMSRAETAQGRCEEMKRELEAARIGGPVISSLNAQVKVLLTDLASCRKAVIERDQEIGVMRQRERAQSYPPSESTPIPSHPIPSQPATGPVWMWGLNDCGSMSHVGLHEHILGDDKTYSCSFFECNTPTCAQIEVAMVKGARVRCKDATKSERIIKASDTHCFLAKNSDNWEAKEHFDLVAKAPAPVDTDGK